MISNNLKLRLITSFFLITLIILLFKYKFILIYSLIVFGVISFLEFSNLINKVKLSTVNRLISNTLFLFYVFLFCFLFFLFNSFIQLKFLLFTILLGCVASDIGGFVFGKILNGPKLTKISPKKTYAGSLGSIILTCLTLSFLFYFISDTFSFKILLISILTSIACQLGDLFFSFIKRKAKIKDTGNLLPGHGGLLDRLDGIFFGMPVGFLSLIIFYS